LDIKVISGIVGVVFTFGALFVQVGEVLNRLSALESKSGPDISVIEKDITTLKEETAVLRTKLEKMENPLGQ
tara:strand:- start:2031 stop:2246 length:216 start_codon:yes stop_codon:yes gene_type:complete